MGICLRAEKLEPFKRLGSVVHFVWYCVGCFCLTVTHSVGLTQHCSGQGPRKTRWLRLDRCSRETSDITAQNVVSRKTHGSRRTKTTNVTVHGQLRC